MQRTITAGAAILLCLLFLGSLVIANGNTVSLEGDATDDSSDVVRARLTTAFNPTLTDAERMKIKEKYMVQANMVRTELGISADALSDDDVAVLMSLGISADRLRQFKSSDDVKKFVMKIKERNSDLVMSIEKRKKYDAELDALEAEKKAIRESTDKRDKLKKWAELLRKISKDRLADPALQARIQAQLDRIKPEVSTVIIADIEAKLKTETNQVRTAHLTKKGAEVLEKANMLSTKLDAVLEKIQAEYDAMADGPKKEVVLKAIVRLTALQERFDAQLVLTRTAYSNFIASGGNTLENAKILNKEIVALKVISKRTVDAVRITGHIIFRLNNADDDADEAEAAEIEVENSIVSVDEVEVETEVEQEVVLETTTTSADTAMTDPTAGGASS